MATCDIQVLVNEAACLSCLSVEQLQAVKSSQLCIRLNNPPNRPNPPCTNLIPDGAFYTDVYTLNLVVGASYTITFGEHEMGLFNGAQEILNPHTSTPVTFIASGDGIFIIPSTNFSTVTAIVCGPACVNLIPKGASFHNGLYYITSLAPNTTYQITFGKNEYDLLLSPGSSPSDLEAPGTFQFTTGPAPLQVYLESAFGHNQDLITATICAV